MKYRLFPNPVRRVVQVGFQKDSKWMYTGSEDGTVKIWDLRVPGCQREYASRAAVTTVTLHPNQGELISGEGSRIPSQQQHLPRNRGGCSPLARRMKGERKSERAPATAVATLVNNGLPWG